jgi:hypothetical protein
MDDIQALRNWALGLEPSEVQAAANVACQWCSGLMLMEVLMVYTRQTDVANGSQIHSYYGLGNACWAAEYQPSRAGQVVVLRSDQGSFPAHSICLSL